MKKIILILLIFTLLGSTLMGCSRDNTDILQTKENHAYLEVLVEGFPNYVFHLYSVAGIGYENEYGAVYKETVKKDDREYLSQNKELLGFANGRFGSLAPAFLFVPLYINPKSKEEVKEYFRLLNQALEKEEYSVFIDKYSEKLNNINEHWVPFNAKEYLQEITQFKEVVKRISDIYVNNYDNYIERVWSVEKEKLISKREKLIKEIDEYNLIEKWQEATGKSFKYSVYQIVLCSANESGANAVSVAYERNHFYYEPNTKINHLVEYISHEVGTHLLFDTFKKVMSSGKYEYSLVYKAYESLAAFYNNKIIFSNRDLSVDFDDYDEVHFFEIYNQIHKNTPDISLEELLVKGIEEYSR